MATEAPSRKGGWLREWGRRLGAAPFLLLMAVALPPPTAGTLLGLPDLCGFRRLTALPCPGCGLTRSLVCACHLRLGESVTYHPLGPVLALGLLVAAWLRFSGREERLPRFTYERAALFFGAALLVLWLGRLLHLLPWPP